VRVTAAAVVLVTIVTGCSSPSAPPRGITAGDIDRGRTAIEARGCVACHVVPGIRRAESSRVGPPLTRYADRSFVAGVLTNNEDNLVRWIMDPKVVDPQTAMPDLDVSEAEARDIVAYLYSRR
jgi:cytochrome c